MNRCSWTDCLEVRGPACSSSEDGEQSVKGLDGVVFEGRVSQELEVLVATLNSAFFVELN